MSHHPESSSKRFMPILLGTSILGGGLISLAVALQTHGQSMGQATPPPATSSAQNSAAIVSPTTPAKSVSTASAPASSPVAQTPPRTVDTFQTSTLPSTGTVTKLEAGDLMCYMTITDDRGATRRLGATFEICEQTSFLNQRVRFFYEPASVNDCESAEPCGNTRRVLLVSRMERIDAASGTNPAQPADRYTITNGEWTITVGNLQSWSGVNNTGDLTYNACNTQNECLQLRGGRMSCTNGVCAMGWQNGDYLYSLESPMGGEDSTARQIETTTLTVRQGDAVIMRAGGFRQVNN